MWGPPKPVSRRALRSWGLSPCNISQHGVLISKPDADCGKRAIKIKRVALSRIQSAIDSTQEEIRAVSKRDFRIGVADREPGKAAGIWYDNGFRRRPVQGVAVEHAIKRPDQMRVVMDIGFLPAEQQCEIRAPVESEKQVSSLPRIAAEPSQASDGPIPMKLRFTWPVW